MCSLARARACVVVSIVILCYCHSARRVPQPPRRWAGPVGHSGVRPSPRRARARPAVIGRTACAPPAPRAYAARITTALGGVYVCATVVAACYTAVFLPRRAHRQTGADTAAPRRRPVVRRRTCHSSVTHHATAATRRRHTGGQAAVVHGAVYRYLYYTVFVLHRRVRSSG